MVICPTHVCPVSDQVKAMSGQENEGVICVRKSEGGKQCMGYDYAVLTAL